MGTGWSVRLVSPPGARPASLQAGIQARLDRVVRQMSGWEADSDLSRFNRAPPGTRQRLPPEFAAVLRAGLDIAEATGGAFDPTMAPLVDLWGFGPRPAAGEEPPDAASVRAALARVGWARLRLDGDTLLQPGGAALDLSGIAKGYGVDSVAEFLAGEGIAAFLVEVGGELRGAGVKPDGNPWWVALEDPPAEARGEMPREIPGEAAGEAPAPAAGPFLVALHGLAVATSGNYRRFLVHGGQRLGHTLDPRTGWPVEAGGGAPDAVTVLHASCMRADALATALAVLGHEAGLAHAARHGIAALFRAGISARMSPAFRAMLD
nr:FAD:protein FMN transferase [Roseomonas acroporae]